MTPRILTPAFALALACATLLVPRSAPAQLNYVFDALVRHPLTEEGPTMPEMYYDDQFVDLFNTLERVGAGETCQTGQTAILEQLNHLRHEGSSLLDGYSYGPVWIDSPSGDGHFAVVVYPTRQGAETFEDAV